MASAQCYPDKSPKLNQLLDTLSDNVRRELIYCFEQVSETETARLETLVSHIDERTPGSDPKRIRVGLVHTHLPRLQDCGWLRFDARSETVRYDGHGRAAELLAETTTLFE